jgi:tetratricopeptide (TPR) repeat protein
MAMRRDANARDAFETGLKYVEGEISGNPIVLAGTRGTGKNEVLNLIKDRIAAGDTRVCFVKCVPTPETRPYEPVIILAEQLTGKFIDALDGMEIVGIFRSALENREKVALMVEDITNMNGLSLDLFHGLIREFSRKPNIKFLMSAVSDGENDERLIGQLETISPVEIVRIHPPTKEDMEFLIGEWGYKLPNEVIETLYSMTDANMELVRYSLIYYESTGYINEDKSMNEVMLRYIPLPPTMEIFYEAMVGKLGSSEMEILYLILVLQGSATRDRIADLIGEPLVKVTAQLASLKEKRMVSETGNYLTIPSNQFRDYLSKSNRSEIMDKIAERLSSNHKYETLPPPVALAILTRSGDADNIVAYLKERGENLISYFPSYGAFLQQLESSLNIVGPDGETLIRPLICMAYFHSGRVRECISCIDAFFRGRHETPDLLLLKGRALLALGLNREAMSIAENLFRAEGTSMSLKLGASILIGRIQLTERRYDEAEATLRGALDLAKRLEDKCTIAESLNSLGIVELNRFSLDKAHALFSDALLGARACHDYRVLLRILNNLAVTYDYSGNYGNAIPLYNEVVELSLFLGDIRARAYATFNLFESYELTGERKRSKEIAVIEEKLLALIDDPVLSYFFYRSAARFYAFELEMDKAIECCSKAIKYARLTDHAQWIDIANGLNGIIRGISGENVDDDATLELITKEYKEMEDFLPFYYGLGGFFLELSGRSDLRKKAFGNIIKSTENSKEYASKAASLLARVISAIFENRPQDAMDILRNDFPADSGISVMTMMHDLYAELEKSGIARPGEYGKSVDGIIEKYREKISPIFIFLVLIFKMSLLCMTDRSYDMSGEMNALESLRLPARILARVQKHFGAGE